MGYARGVLAYSDLANAVSVLVSSRKVFGLHGRKGARYGILRSGGSLWEKHVQGRIERPAALVRRRSDAQHPGA